MSSCSERYTETDSEHDGSMSSFDTMTSTFVDSDTDWSRVRNHVDNDTIVGSESDDGTLVSSTGESYAMISPLPSIRDDGSSSTPTTPSVMSLDDARLSIDAFFANPQVYASRQSNKLRFWQALCIEFGLVDLGSNDISSTPEIKLAHDEIATWASSIIDSISSIGNITSGITTSTSTLPTAGKPENKNKTKKSRKLPPLPTTLSQAKALLMRRAHVNLWDYMAAREPDIPDPDPSNGKKIHPPKNYAHLVWPNQKALVGYTLRTGKIVYKDQAKEEWLNPILRDISKLQIKYGLSSTGCGLQSRKNRYGKRRDTEQFDNVKMYPGGRLWSNGRHINTHTRGKGRWQIKG